MKPFTKTLLSTVLGVMMFPVTSVFADAPTREHRSIWMTPFLSNNWPSSAITESNAKQVQNILVNRLKKFKDQNINVIYYHARSMCDATYDSAYEPWSRTVSGTRGVAPAFDPFGFLVEQAHEYGIEVYAWINPYRYCSTSKYGEGELNYENSHPDWLISQSNETILNPGLEEVKQRIVDVILDILSKYDVDGIIFDDYFYTSGTPMNLDADLYADYKASGGNLSQADWRRANVNDMVQRVHDAIKQAKPWVAFGISPAGVASPPTVTSEYGLQPVPGGGDWQYNGIYSDPLAWLKAGTIDFISPQIYWPNRFDVLSEWWSNAAVKYNRHFYPSVTLSSISTYKYSEFAREIDYNRLVSPAGSPGFVFFQYSDFVNYYERWNNKSTDFGTILSEDVFNTKALTPIRLWEKTPDPDMVSNVVLDSDSLKWDATPAGRYAVYRKPVTQTTGALVLDGISYRNAYVLPKDAADYDWFVAAYDRYGKTSTPLGVGASPQTGTAPVLLYPAEGENPVDLFEFKWEHDSYLNRYTVELAVDADFESILGIMEVEGHTASLSGMPSLTRGEKYYWRVKATDINREHPVSASSWFIAPKIAFTSENHDLDIRHTFEWTAAVDGAEYIFEISRNADMTSPILHEVVSTTSFTTPSHVLATGRQYYARVTASIGTASSSSEIMPFTTVNKDDYEAPVMLNPAEDGLTLHSNEVISIAPWEGMSSVTVQIAETTEFPTRSSYSYTLSDYATSTPELGTIKITSKALVDGKTYYVRARGTYSLTTTDAPVYTDYSPVRSFVYSSEAGVGDVVAEENAVWIDADLMLHVNDSVKSVAVYTIAGVKLAEYNCDGVNQISLESLEPGAYVISAGSHTLKLVK
ncbi:MAG: family 10 glycosylhydrolase [Muribaculaceae bacterium]|nr:family 10 glycosylhydrolase [Muribaculaceae bacterium]